MPQNFVRSLGYQPGTQLNPLRDLSGGAGSLGFWDQIVALPMRATRGRIDKPFRVNAGNFKTLLGKPQSTSLLDLNEAMVQGYEALRKGAKELLVHRLSVSAAVLKWVIFKSDATSVWSVATNAPDPTAMTAGVADYTLAIKHLLCHNDGIQVAVHADIKRNAEGASVSTKLVTVTISDADGLELHRVTGSLDSTALDDAGNSLYLPEVSERTLGDIIEWSIHTDVNIKATDEAYGLTTAGREKWASSGVKNGFVSGGTTFLDADYQLAATRLEASPEPFGYIISGGSTSVPLIVALEELAFQTNRQLLIDVPGDLAPAAAITFVEQFGFNTLGRDHYPQFYWCPVKALDPLNGNLAFIGTGGAQAGLRCARNAIVNAYGFAAKERPIAGKDYPLSRNRMRVFYNPTEAEKSDLAKARINPVIPQQFEAGQAIVFSDCLTGAFTTTSYRKLIPTAEMSAHLDEEVVRIANDARMLPQGESIIFMSKRLEDRFSKANSSGWLVDGKDANGESVVAYEFTVERHPIDTVDTLIVSYWLHYPGTNRRTFVQQTIR